MNEELLKLAQAEYQRQYNNWLRAKPNKNEFYESVENLIKYYSKITSKNSGAKK